MSEGFRNSPASHRSPDGWFDQFRQACQNVRIEPDSSHASEVSADEMLAFYRGELSEDRRRELEAEALASPACFRKLVELGACTATQATAGHVHVRVESAKWGEVELPPPRPVSSWVAALESSNISCRIDSNPPLEIRRIVLNGQDLVRIDRLSDCAGALVAVDRQGANKTFAVCRVASSSGVAAIANLSTASQSEVARCSIHRVAPQDLQSCDAAILWEAFQTARQIDPAAVAPIDGPRSSWELWTEEVLLHADHDPQGVDAEVLKIVERIASEFA